MPTALVTGANRGIGLELTRQLAGRGWSVHAACRDPAKAADLRRLAEESGGQVKVLAMDVAATSSVAAAAATLDGKALDLLINNAGVYGPQRQPLSGLDETAWRQVLEVNTLGPARVLQAFAGNLARGERRLAVAITSGMGSLADNSSGGSIYYRTSKAALNMLMRSAAFELKPQKIVCIVVNPGWVRTDMGGPGGKISVAQSAEGILGVIDRLGPADSGGFFNWDGKTYPW